MLNADYIRIACQVFIIMLQNLILTVRKVFRVKCTGKVFSRSAEKETKHIEVIRIVTHEDRMLTLALE